ncbi:MAG: rhomboid family intramembrane serine protease [Rubrivivax sp.]|nr:MAG: rhomboid family intramembrane serine protease [Rubrivivax sp.]
MLPLTAPRLHVKGAWLLQRPGAAWLAVALLIALPAWWLGPVTFSSSWALHPPAGLSGNPVSAWWTPAWAHATAQHLSANLWACGLMAVLGLAARLPPRAALAWLMAWPATHVLLMLDPRLAAYLGASGVLHAGAAIVGVWLWRSGRRGLAGIWLLALCVKVLYDLSLGMPTAIRPGLDTPVSTLSHLAGTLSGLFFAGFLGAPRREKT